jgi:hypothetical protein
MAMLILEIFIVLFVISMILFGRIEIHKTTGVFKLKLGMKIREGKYFPLISIDRSASTEEKD